MMGRGEGAVSRSGTAQRGRQVKACASALQLVEGVLRAAQRKGIGITRGVHSQWRSTAEGGWQPLFHGSAWGEEMKVVRACDRIAVPLVGRRADLHMLIWWSAGVMHGCGVGRECRL